MKKFITIIIRTMHQAPEVIYTVSQ